VRYNPAVRRLPRTIFDSLVGLSLIMYVAAIAMWVRSYRFIDTVTFEFRGRAIEWVSAYGRIRLSNEPEIRRHQSQLMLQVLIDEVHSGPPSQSPPPPPQPSPPAPAPIEFNLPYWAVLAFTTPGLTWIVVRSRRRDVPGLCRVCGYDLRATPDRCPECGNVPGGR
jgi:hypothetical protein